METVTLSLLKIPVEILREIFLFAFDGFKQEEETMRALFWVRVCSMQLRSFIDNTLFTSVLGLDTIVETALGDKGILYFPRLQELTMSYRLSGSTVLRHFTHIQRLYTGPIGHDLITKARDYMPLGNLLAGLPSLKMLDIGTSMKEGDLVEAINLCVNLEELRILRPSGGIDTDRLTCFAHLRRLTLARVDIVESVGNGWTRLTNLEELTLNACLPVFSCTVLDAVAPFLRSLELSTRGDHEQEIYLSVAHTHRMTRLETLSLVGILRRSDGLLVPFASSLRELEIHESVSPTYLGVEKLSNLEKLCIVDHRIATPSLITDELIRGLTNLTSLGITSVYDQGDDDFVPIGLTNKGLSLLKKLVEVDLFCVSQCVTHEGFLGSSRSLRQLSVQFSDGPEWTQPQYQSLITDLAIEFPLLTEIDYTGVCYHKIRHMKSSRNIRDDIQWIRDVARRVTRNIRK